MDSIAASASVLTAPCMPFLLLCLQTANYLKDTWVVTLKNAIKSSFKDVGKGWFNLHESNMET
eukprot:scaffold105395_cov19-Tisochrysis_lutea.AAC.1